MISADVKHARERIRFPIGSGAGHRREGGAVPPARDVVGVLDAVCYHEVYNTDRVNLMTRASTPGWRFERDSRERWKRGARPGEMDL
jgi:hypothetical protein